MMSPSFVGIVPEQTDLAATVNDNELVAGSKRLLPHFQRWLSE
jgi:hypothetical protein